MRIEFIVREQMVLKLEAAQALMAEVYAWACREEHDSISPLSDADTCILEALDTFKLEFQDIVVKKD